MFGMFTLLLNYGGGFLSHYLTLSGEMSPFCLRSRILLRCLNNDKVRPFPPPKSMKLRKGLGFFSSLHEEEEEGVFTKFEIFSRRLSMIDNTWWISLKENKTFGLHHDKSLYVNIIPMRS